MSKHQPIMNRSSDTVKNFKKAIKKLLGYLKPHKMQLGIILIFSILGTVFAIFSPKILGMATTRIADGIMARNDNPYATIDFEYVGVILLVVGALYTLSAIFNYARGYLMAGVTQKIAYQIRSEIARKINKLPLKFFDKHAHGDLLSKLTNDVEKVSDNLGYVFTSLLVSVVTLVGIFIMMLTISPVMTLIAVLTIPTSGVIITLIINRSQKHFDNHQAYLGEINGYVEEVYASHDVVKAFNAEKQNVKKFNELSENLYEASWKSQFLAGTMMPVINVITNIGYALVSILGGYYAVQQTIAIGDIQAFIQYLRQFNNPIRQITGIMASLQSTVAAAERIFEFLEEGEELPPSRHVKSLESVKGEISFNDVTFGYRPNEPVIKKVSCKIEAGQKVAIVGPTGAGKTTIVNLLMRFYDVDSGSIEVDGIDIRDLDKNQLRNMLGMVLQDTWLFNGTVKDNIAFGKLDATEEEIKEACRAAYVDEFIQKAPLGYDMVINDESNNISVGQKQLLTIARTIISNPAVLILDEATSSVDTRTELMIGKAMENVMKGRTSFIIAHRLSTIKEADIILVMNEGRLVETGKHEDLLKANGFYAQLYYSQFEEMSC